MTNEEYENQTMQILERTRRIKNKIAIFSGKGGVGKSSVAALLASALADKGKVAILDADITGPSIPRMFGIDQKPQTDGTSIIPPQTKKGIKIMSMNLLLDQCNQPVIWRGPMVASTIRQFLSETEWGEIDYLILDMPPGTSDASLTVIMSLPLDGIIFVTSPQELVAMIVEKAMNMAYKMNAPILGVIENMGELVCPHCKKTIEPFGKSDAEEVACRNGTVLLGKVPFDPKIAILCDSGKIEEYTNECIKGIVDNMEGLKK